MMLTITLIGADGSGKSTLGKNLREALKDPAVYIYLGENPQTATHMLPTTRLWVSIKKHTDNPDLGGPPDPAKIDPLPKGPIKRFLKELKSAARIANLMAEEWYRQLIIWTYQARGFIVITDRHYCLDYYYHHIHPRGRPLTLAARFHGFTLASLYPKPTLVLFLDAPAAVLFARKGEGSLELLELRRQEYIKLSSAVKHFYTIDATQPIETVTRHAVDLILAHNKCKSI